jgi:hypothetical protein
VLTDQAQRRDVRLAARRIFERVLDPAPGLGALGDDREMMTLGLELVADDMVVPDVATNRRRRRRTRVVMGVRIR